jgi:hypothetical protein
LYLRALQLTRNTALFMLYYTKTREKRPHNQCSWQQLCTLSHFKQQVFIFDFGSLNYEKNVAHSTIRPKYSVRKFIFSSNISICNPFHHFIVTMITLINTNMARNWNFVVCARFQLNAVTRVARADLYTVIAQT